MYRMIGHSFVIINPAVLHQEAVGFVNSVGCGLSLPALLMERLVEGSGGDSSIPPLLCKAEPSSTEKGRRDGTPLPSLI